MKRAAIILLLNALPWVPVSGNAQEDYAQALDRLKSNRSRIEQGLKRLGVRSETAPAPGGNSLALPDHSSEAERPKLLHVYLKKGELKARAGSFLFGTLHTRLIVGPEGSPLVVALGEDQGVFSGSRLLGRARQSATSGRVQLELDRLVMNSAGVVSIKALGLDSDGAVGIPAQVFSGKALSIAGSLAASFISGLAASQQTWVQSPFGVTQPQPSGRNGILQGVAKSAADQGQRFIEESTAEKPVLVIEAGTPVSIYLDEEVRW